MQILLHLTFIDKCRMENILFTTFLNAADCKKLYISYVM